MSRPSALAAVQFLRDPHAVAAKIKRLHQCGFAFFVERQLGLAPRGEPSRKVGQEADQFAVEALICSTGEDRRRRDLGRASSFLMRSRSILISASLFARQRACRSALLIGFDLAIAASLRNEEAR